MQHSHSTLQTSVFDFNILQIEIPADHPLIRIEKEIPWEELLEIVRENYSATTGRNTKSLRMMMALEIAKHILREDDRSLIRRLETDIALKLFCGFTTMEHDIPHPTSLTKFRKNLNDETLRKLEDVSMRKFIRKMPKKRRHQCITDSTCIPGNITFPIDSKLLLKTWKRLVSELRKIKVGGKKIIIRGRRRVEKAAAGFRKKKRHAIEEIQAFNQLLVDEGRKLLSLLQKQLRDTASEINNELLRTIITILEQQGEMLRKNVRRCKNRIVSLSEPDIRPIPRGKEGGKKTEFGKKITVSVIGGKLLRTDRIDDNAFSDTEMVDDAIKTHERCFGRKPSEMNTDRGGHSPKNHDALEKENIIDGIQYKGAVPKKANLPPDTSIKRMRCQRSVVEAKIGTAKTRYGLERNPYKHAHAYVKITFALLAMNATTVARASPT